MVTFDRSLLEEAETEVLQEGKLQLNELTLESLQHTCVGGGAAALWEEGGPWVGW